MKKGIKKGFTLIELSFAILFISTLLLTVTLIASEIISIYRKGYAIKTVNSVGRDLIDEFSNAVSGINPGKTSAYCDSEMTGSGKTICSNSTDSSFPGSKFFQQQFTTPMKYKANSSGGEEINNDTVYGGIFCTGKYSYIYQTGFTKNSEFYKPTDDNSYRGIALSYNYYNASGAKTTIMNRTDFSLLKFTDPKRDLCIRNINTSDYSLKRSDTRLGGKKYHVINLTKITGTTEDNAFPEEPVELLSKSDTPLALFDFYLAPPAQTSSTGKTLYSISFILATVSGGVNIYTNGNYCTAPMGFNADFSYCAINKFNFTIQANGGGKKDD